MADVWLSKSDFVFMKYVQKQYPKPKESLGFKWQKNINEKVPPAFFSVRKEGQDTCWAFSRLDRRLFFHKNLSFQARRKPIQRRASLELTGPKSL